MEIKAGASYQSATYRGVPLVFRLGARTMVDTIRITWPNGLIQNEMNRPPTASTLSRRRRASPARAP